MRTTTYTDADFKRLIDGGWTEIKDAEGKGTGQWLIGKMNPRLGGYHTGEALRQQDKLDIIAKFGAYYYAKQDMYGFGYWLGVYENNLDSPHRVKGFDHLDETTAMKLVTLFNNTKDYEPILGIDYQPQKFQQIVVFKEKYGERHFIVNTRQELEKVAIKIVTERNEEGWYDFEHEKPIEPKMTVADAEKFGMSGVTEATKREWENFKYSKKAYDEGLKLQVALERVINAQDGEAALQILRANKDGEYEGFEVISGEEFE